MANPIDYSTHQLFHLAEKFLVFDVVAHLEDIQRPVFDILELDELRLLVHHDFLGLEVHVDVWFFVPALSVGALSILRPLDHADPIVSDALIKLLELGVGASGNRIPEAFACALLVVLEVLDPVDDDGDVVTAVGEGLAEGIQHFQLVVRQHEPFVGVLESGDDEEPDFLEVGSHGLDVVEVYELPEAGVVSVAGHVDDGAFVVAALLVEVGLLGH